jgi:hypothetical protein
MGYIVTYGIGGYCEDCSAEHDHPLHNIVEEVFVEEQEQDIQDRKAEILQKLGLTEEEVQILLGDINAN